MGIKAEYLFWGIAPFLQKPGTFAPQKRQKQSGLSMLLPLPGRQLYYFLNPKILLKIFFLSFSFFCGFPQARTCEDPACRPFSGLRLASAEEQHPVSVGLHSASAGCLDSASSELRLCHGRCFLGVHCFLYQGAAEGLHSQHCYRCCHCYHSGCLLLRRLLLDCRYFLVCSPSWFCGYGLFC